MNLNLKTIIKMTGIVLLSLPAIVNASEREQIRSDRRPLNQTDSMRLELVIDTLSHNNELGGRIMHDNSDRLQSNQSPESGIPMNFSGAASANAANSGSSFSYYDSQITMPSYQSVGMLRDVSIPVDYYTGRASISIPLYEIKTPHLSVPITMNYQSSGIRVEDYETWVGLGWNLNPGGSITRIVRGFPDEWGYSRTINPQGNLDLNQWRIETHFTTQYKIHDGEPDIFFFQVPGYSGQFVIDYNGNIHIMPYQNLKIEWVNQTSFMITDPYGNKYYLGSSTNSRETAKNISENYPKPNDDYHTSTWHLDYIKNLDNQNIVEFTYKNGYQYDTQYIDTNFKIKMTSGLNTVERLVSTKDNTIKTRIKPKYLEKIEWQGGYIKFTSGLQTDKGINRLSTIYIYNYDDKKIKSYDFAYSNFNNGRWRLDEIIQSSYLGYKTKFCSFSYCSTDLPGRESNHFDFWGYYDVPSGNPWPYFNMPTGTLITSGWNRSPNLDRTKANILMRINYPNGSYREFEYELNSGIPKGETNIVALGGLRIASVKLYPKLGATATEAITTRYEYKSGYSAGIYGGVARTVSEEDRLYQVSLKNHIYKTDFNGTSVGYGEVKEILPNGSYNVYKYDTFNNYDDELGSRCIVDTGNKTWETDTAGRVAKSSYFWKRGNLKEQSSYDYNGNLISKNVYTYNYASVTSIPAYTFIIQNEDHDIFFGSSWYHVGRYYWHIQKHTLSSIVSTNKYGIGTTTTFVYNPNSLPAKITVTGTDGTVMETKNVYSGDITVSSSSSTPAIKALRNMKAKGYNAYPIETITAKNGNVISGSLTTYNEYAEAFLPFESWSIKTAAPLNYSTATFPLASFSGSNITKHSSYTLDSTIDAFSSNGMALSGFGPGNVRKSIILGHNGSLKIADVENAKYSEESGRNNEVFHTSFEDLTTGYRIPGKAGMKSLTTTYRIPLSNFITGNYQLSYWIYSGSKWNYVEKTISVSSTTSYYTITGTENNYIDEVRVMPKDARMVTYTYDANGVTSVTDNNGMTTHYGYNGLGLLKEVRNNEFTVIEKTTYDDLSIPF